MAEKFVLVSTLDSLEKGEQFTLWPLHVTVMPWFSMPDGNRQAFKNTLTNRLHDVAPIVARGDAEALFGLTKDVPVRTLHSMGALASLHALALEVVERFDGAVDSPYVGSNYIPHITNQNGEGIEEGQEVRFDAVQLIRGDVNGLRTVERVFYLANETKRLA